MEIKTIFVGLGNPTSQYNHTRHNLGFLAVDVFLEYLNLNPLYSVSLVSSHRKLCDLWKVSNSSDGTVFLLCKPLTYMNNSGQCVQKLYSTYNVPLSSICILHDELDIPLKKVKIKHGGGDSGHNGLRSITTSLSSSYTRFRLGIGRPLSQDICIHDWVLGKWSKEEYSSICVLLNNIIPVFLSFVQKGISEARQTLSNVL
ncbi:MAG: aminoacyl-tRNA hydrolase [Desulfovibrionaceae bacterium]